MLWNGRKIPARLYSGVDGGTLRRTQHSWGMRGGCCGLDGICANPPVLVLAPHCGRTGWRLGLEHMQMPGTYALHMQACSLAHAET